MDWKNKIVVVTGADKAAGRAVALIGVYRLSCLAGSMPKADIFSDASFQADEPGSAAT